MRIKNYTLAIQKYSKAIECIPNFREAIDNRSFCYMDLGDWENAVKGLHHSLELEPNNFQVLFSIGECYLRLSKYRKAKEYYEKAREFDPNHSKLKEILDILKNVPSNGKQ